MKSSSKKIAIFIFCLVFIFSSFHVNSANAWASIAAASVRTGLDIAWQQIKGAVMGALKQGAGMAIFQSMTSFVGGSSSGGGLVIRNWSEALFSEPKDNSDKAIDDYISQTIGGRGGSKYQGVGGGSYTNELAEIGKKATSEKKDPQVTYTNDPTKMFDSEDGFKQLNEYTSGLNNPWAYEIDAEEKYEAISAQEQKTAEASSIANKGFKSMGGNNDVSMPGSLVESNLSNVQDIGNKVMSGSGEMSEVIVTAILNAIINQMMMQGL